MSSSHWNKGRNRNLETMPYDPMLGWYTASTLGAMLMCFLLCVACDKVKQRVVRYHKFRTQRQMQMLTVKRDDSPDRQSLPAIVFEDEDGLNSPTKREASDADANQCPRVEPDKVTNKNIPDPTLSPTLSLQDTKLQILEVHPDCPLHSPRSSVRSSFLADENDSCS
jgi:hypothetical protein